MWINNSHRTAEAAWNALGSARVRLQKKQMEHVKTLYDTRKWPDGVTREELEKELNEGRPFRAQKTTDKLQQVEWLDSGSGLSAEFYFQDGQWRGYSMHSGNAVPSDPQPTRTSFDLATEHIRQTVAGWNSGVAPTVWIVLFLMSMIWPRCRRVWAELALACAVISTTAWLVHPGYGLSWRAIRSNDMLVWAAVMLVASSLALWMPGWRREVVGPPVCPECGYNLTGNISGICPECGTPIAEELRGRIRR